ncbi:hypothetical protein RJT34_10815 [Clitoria ternatea]|uniref:Uncharacterized protein n=1 Tax=Clitoria ternatea TaxID=43366 RepID=A0AAN9JKQ8_CLITE
MSGVEGGEPGTAVEGGEDGEVEGAHRDGNKRKVRCGSVKSEDGVEPLRLLRERCREVRCVRLEKEGGIDPLKLVPLRLRVTKVEERLSEVILIEDMLVPSKTSSFKTVAFWRSFFHVLSFHSKSLWVRSSETIIWKGVRFEKEFHLAC